MRPFRFLSWGIVLATVAHAVAVYGQLPDRIPTGLDAAGAARGWTDRSPLSWFVLPGLLIALQLLFDLLATLLPTRPQLVNLPNKEKLLALPARWRAPVMQEVVRMMDATGLGVALLFALIQWQMVRAAQARPVPIGVAGVVLPIALTVVLLLFVSRIGTRLDDAHRAWQAAGAPAE